MRNDELIYKLNVIINYLKKNGGNNYKVCDYGCTNINYPNSNIVEYAEQIKKELTGYDDYSLFVINEICNLIKDNLKLLLSDNTSLNGLKEYITSERFDAIATPNELLIPLTKEALSNLLNTTFLYDFRNLD